jgi:hypothetical protein
MLKEAAFKAKAKDQLDPSKLLIFNRSVVLLKEGNLIIR